MYYVHIYDRMNCEVAVKERLTIERAKNCTRFYCTSLNKFYAECVDEDFNRVFWYQNGKFEY